MTAQRRERAKPAARRPYAKPRVERVPIKPDEALLACECKNVPHICEGGPGRRPRS
ncbi:MAG: hypothetical protein PHU25_06780 [Deltaproteobacteria bacterium]|nr:hypothetical protein [Deltaproteobacteria bacterium]